MEVVHLLLKRRFADRLEQGFELGEGGDAVRCGHESGSGIVGAGIAALRRECKRTSGHQRCLIM
jgi:hypothetical protein